MKKRLCEERAKSVLSVLSQSNQLGVDSQFYDSIHSRIYNCSLDSLDYCSMIHSKIGRLNNLLRHALPLYLSHCSFESSTKRYHGTKEQCSTEIYTIVQSMSQLKLTLSVKKINQKYIH